MNTLFAVLLTLTFSVAPLSQAPGEDREQKFDQIIDRFIDYDTGKLPGAEGKHAMAEFTKLGPEALPALIRGLNRAAKIEHSCPAVTIAKKLNAMLRASQSPGLLEFARENIGAGVTQSSHMGVIKDLRVLCMLRKRVLLERGVTDPDEAPEPARTSTLETQPRRKKVRELTTKELAEGTGTERGLRLRMVLEELGKREGTEAIDALGSAASTREGEPQKLARELLAKKMDSLDNTTLKAKLKDDRPEIRMAAIRAAGSRSLRMGEALIELLSDTDDSIRQAARESLKRVSGGQDLGPKSDANEADRKHAAEQWRAWLAAQNGR
jgi:hypothetical protein